MVIVHHEAGTGKERTVTADVYLNYDDSSSDVVEGFHGGEGGVLRPGWCAQTPVCPSRSACGGDSMEAEVRTVARNGRVRAGSFRDDPTSHWTLMGEAGLWAGALLEGHEAASSFVCLPPGDYELISSETVSRPDEEEASPLWEVCGSGGTVAVTVDGETVKTCSPPAVGSVGRSTDEEEEEEEVVVPFSVSRALLEDPGTGDDSMCDVCMDYLPQASGVTSLRLVESFLFIYLDGGVCFGGNLFFVMPRASSGPCVP
eukprot:jgi/Undpi1/8377/HiC_scaffold_25.g10845.m1